MVWIYVALGVALIGLVLIGWYVLVLYRKLGALLGELGVAADRAAEALDLLARIEVPDRLGGGGYDATFRSEPEVDDDLTADPWVDGRARSGRRT